MKKSERNLMIGCGIAVLAAIGYNFMAPAGGDTGAAGGASTEIVADASSLEASRALLRQYMETLRDRKKIRDKYREVGGRTAPPGSGQGPPELFSDEMYNMLRQEGFQLPPLETPKYDVIENVEDYCTVEIKVQLAGSLPRIMMLLEHMEQRGMLIKSFTLDRRNTRDANDITFTVVVARVFKQTDESRRRLNPGKYFGK